ncbi:MAG: sigma-70 family RNA polymerase sigma factor [Actinomycetota bacterium]|nr:sigma-70 family RNA polymerase sigma factor [Actinomycetota bacterium]
MRARRGDALEFESFCLREYERVFRAVRLLGGDDELARDATQEAFTKAFVRWRRLQKEPWAGGWVMTTALNASKRSLKKVARESRSTAPAADTASEANRAERVDIVSALRRLPGRQQEVAVLYYWGDLSTSSIAQLLSLSEGTVRAHLAHARDKLRGLLEVADA